MKGKRWSEEEDYYLRDEVLRSISEGASQLDAFEKVGKELGRTSGACGFRWNAVLRQQNPVAYTEAKRKRVYTQLQKKRRPQVTTFASLYQSLQQAEKDWNKLKAEYQKLQKQIEMREVQLQQLKKENLTLQSSRVHAPAFQQEMMDRYQELLELVQRLKENPSFSLTKFAHNHDSTKADNETDLKPST
ncbi:hypothetical protein [Risungbinella massiliensis]|uniref:hypothetical protein n=1 Tax=Risungbinella massiliensis TaxID=1329796 RepID=UPI00069A4CDF|nr:hypothetical protein [Risungbinella massiliensis]